MDLCKKISALLFSILLLAGCADKKVPPTEEAIADTSTAQEAEALASEAERLTAWSVYWDCADDMELLRNEADNVDEISLFAAYFQDGELVIPEATAQMLKKIRRRDATNGKTVYLSVVNDVRANGKTTQKDTAILEQLLGTDAAAQEHAEQLVRLASENGYDGIEIDYEKLRKNMNLWELFLNFERKLLPLAQAAGLKVRIILEPGIPADQLDFPEGAEYVVMCYNLFGSGTEPGPKADFAFLQQLVEKFSSVPELSYALANGGYIWEEGSTAPTQCRASEAKALAEKAGIEPERDPDSGALFFSCMDGKTRYTVWYADETTLAQWTQKLNELAVKKVPVSLWRL